MKKIPALLLATSGLLCNATISADMIEDHSVQDMPASCHYYSQCGQDQFLNEHFFKNKPNGVFVEVGAFDGISLSNTKFFEELGWTGLCIEPIPEKFQTLRKNRSCLCIQGCVSDSNRIDQFLWLEGEPAMLSGLLSKYDERHLQRIHEEVATRSFGREPQTIDVQCYLLNDLLKVHQLFYVDFLSIDTEGGELEILQSIDYDRFHIEFIDVENNFHDPEIVNFMISKGYEHIGNTGWDDLFKKKS